MWRSDPFAMMVTAGLIACIWSHSPAVECARTDIEPNDLVLQDSKSELRLQSDQIRLQFAHDDEKRHIELAKLAKRHSVDELKDILPSLPPMPRVVMWNGQSFYSHYRTDFHYVVTVSGGCDAISEVVFTRIELSADDYLAMQLPVTASKVLKCNHLWKPNGAGEG